MWGATALTRRCLASVAEAEVLCHCRLGPRIVCEGRVSFELVGVLRGNVPNPSSGRNCGSFARLDGPSITVFRLPAAGFFFFALQLFSVRVY